MRSGQLPVSIARREPELNVAFLNANAQLGLDLFRQEIAAKAIRSGRRFVCALDSDRPPTFRLSVLNGLFVFETWLPGEQLPAVPGSDILVLW